MAQSSYTVLALQREARHREDAPQPSALACTDQADFLRRIGERHDAHAGLPSPADPEA